MVDVPTRPRRWNTEVEGIKWIPRLTDKARMSIAGTLGTYLIGHSPVDFALLKRLNMTTEAFVALAAATTNDAEVLAALRARGFDEASVRRWSDRFESSYRVYIPLWDLDEGYVAPSTLQKLLLPFMRAIEGPAMDLVRKVRPLP